MLVSEKFKVKDKKLQLNEGASHLVKQEAVMKLIQNVFGLVDVSY